MMDFQVFPLGDQAVLLEFGTNINKNIHLNIWQVSALLEKTSPSWMMEYIPAFTTITVVYDAASILFPEVCQELKVLFSDLEKSEPIDSQVVEIPVCYGGNMGPDLEYVANYNHLTMDEVVKIHTAQDYLVYMIGFAPGFPYIGGMSEKIAAPRKKTPRLKIPARSVGIAGMQTGIYPIETPGGWQIIGRTPINLFLPDKEIPSLLKAGDRLKFHPISLEEFLELESNQ
jgi:inhibitor of KinA